MTTRGRDGVVSIALPVRNGAATLAPVIESVLAQSHADIELVICDNASSDATEEICREFARADSRVAYHRHRTNIGLLNNFRYAADRTTGGYVHWMGDADSIHPDYVARTLAVFAEDSRRVLVTTQVTYVGPDGSTTLDRTYRPTALASPDPVERVAELLRLLTGNFAWLDPLYGLMRRDVATLPRRNMLQEDQVFATRLAVAGPWGHVPAPLARRTRSELDIVGTAALLGVPKSGRHVRDVLQCLETLRWVDGALDPSQRRQVRAHVAQFYLRRKLDRVERGVAKARRLSRSVSPRRLDVSR